jgi:NADP-dependent 3-hydroxy acid dehydrogenase YdfG
MKNSLVDHWIVITGASGGIGAATARAFAELGCRLLLGARRLDRLEIVAQACRDLGAPEVLAYALDVSRTASVESFAQWVKQHASRVTVLVNNAGGALGLDPVASGQDADWEAMVQTNVLGLLRVTRAMLPLMQEAEGPTIVNLGSVAGRTAYEGGAVYCGAKAAELQISRALRLELCGTGIRVTSVDPGMTKTDFAEVRFKGDKDRAAKVYAGVNPLTAEDVAEAIVWTASRPPHVCVDELIIKPTDQAAHHKVHRRTGVVESGGGLEVATA